MYILDTDHLSLLGQTSGTPAQQLRARLTEFNIEQRVTTIITFEEQLRGWMAVLAQSRSVRRQVAVYERLQRILNSFSQLTVLEFDDAAAAQFEGLRQVRLRVGTMDLKIAAIALSRDATVLTRNLRDFGQVPHLRVEDWTR